MKRLCIFSLSLNWQICNAGLRAHTALTTEKKEHRIMNLREMSSLERVKVQSKLTSVFIIIEVNLNLPMRMKFTTCSLRQL